MNKFKYKKLYANEFTTYNCCTSISSEQRETLKNILIKKVLILASNPKEIHLLTSDSISSNNEKKINFSRKVNCRPESLERILSRGTDKFPICSGESEKILKKSWILELLKQLPKKKRMINIYMHKYKAAIKVHIEIHIVDVLCQGDLKGTTYWIKKNEDKKNKIKTK